MREEYEEIPYLAGTHAETHPSRIAAHAVLHGLEPAPIEQARVLYVGCARGRNLVPVAADHPGSHVVGVDIAPAQIADAQVLVDRLGLDNVQLYAQDLLEAPLEGPFDYIVAHGFVSWVPPEVRDAFFARCGALLSENGVVYASYNTLPGWHLRRAIRDLLLRGGRGAQGEAAVERGRELLGVVGGIAKARGDLWAKLLEHEHDLIADKGNWYVAHDHMASINEPFYLTQVLEMAAPHGLQYLGEVDGSREVPPLPPPVQQKLQEFAADPVEFEELLDCVGGREFRCTLLCRDDQATHAFALPDRLARLYLSMEGSVEGELALDERVAATFRGKRRSFQIDEPILKAALAVLLEAWPAAVGLERVYGRALKRLGRKAPSEKELRLLCESLLYAVGNGFLEVDLRQRRFVPEVTERPVASRVARAQLAVGDEWVATGWHRTLRLPPFDRALVTRLDGRPWSEVVQGLLAEVDAGRLEVEDLPVDPPRRRTALEALAERRLEILAEKAMLTG